VFVAGVRVVVFVTCCTTSATCFELVRWCCPLVVLYNVRSRCPCSGVMADVVQANLTSYGHVVACPLVVSIAGVRVVEFGSY